MQPSGGLPKEGKSKSLFDGCRLSPDMVEYANRRCHDPDIMSSMGLRIRLKHPTSCACGKFFSSEMHNDFLARHPQKPIIRFLPAPKRHNLCFIFSQWLIC